MSKFTIEIVSDTVCPWCYVGHKKLQKAITAYKAQSPDATFSISWKPYYLNPAAPKTGIDKIEFYKSKFGDDRAAMIFARLAAVGKDVGIDFKFGGKTGNTRDSHRLIHLAGQEEEEEEGGEVLQTRVVEELFKSYFENEEDITDHGVLTAAAVKAGLGEEKVRGWLESDLGGEVVDREVGKAQMMGIRGVPNFTINGKFQMGGAQDHVEFVRAFEQVVEKA
ncbi:DSBA oxidoreductase [Choiromyces venosus 120613-1]|uniref:DSBA oxidoreductase n=1 Tax=Choiromyces venosus 120613-1 TaxID=1336337 RepID=A0A3N4JRY4_9PEZI|nr:DSBA oxidoreductase [Choiromyces venosus 120613-1]